MNQISAPQLPDMTAVWQETLNWQPTPEQQVLFQQLFELIIQFNQQLNLTRLTEPEEFWEKHLWDSLRGISFLLSEKIPYPQEQNLLILGQVEVFLASRWQ